jgi:RimJ/RimL family protein N-acetyltransferase
MSITFRKYNHTKDYGLVSQFLIRHHQPINLDIAAANAGEIAASYTIYYDDYTRSAATVLVGVAAEHWRRGLGKAVVIEGMRRLKHLGCTRVFSTANDDPADALYRSVLREMKVTDTWIKEWKK